MLQSYEKSPQALPMRLLRPRRRILGKQLLDDLQDVSSCMAGAAILRECYIGHCFWCSYPFAVLPKIWISKM